MSWSTYLESLAALLTVDERTEEARQQARARHASQLRDGVERESGVATLGRPSGVS